MAAATAEEEAQPPLLTAQPPLLTVRASVSAKPHVFLCLHTVASRPLDCFERQHGVAQPRWHGTYRTKLKFEHGHEPKETTAGTYIAQSAQSEVTLGYGSRLRAHLTEQSHWPALLRGLPCSLPGARVYVSCRWPAAPVSVVSAFRQSMA